MKKYSIAFLSIVLTFYCVLLTQFNKEESRELSDSDVSNNSSELLSNTEDHEEHSDHCLDLPGDIGEREFYKDYLSGKTFCGYGRLNSFSASVSAKNDKLNMEAFEITGKDLRELLDQAVDQVISIHKGPLNDDGTVSVQETEEIDILEGLENNSMPAAQIDPYLDFCLDILVEKKSIESFFTSNDIIPGYDSISTEESVDNGKLLVTYSFSGEKKLREYYPLPASDDINEQKRVSQTIRNTGRAIYMQEGIKALSAKKSSVSMSDLPRDNNHAIKYLKKILSENIKVNKTWPEEFAVTLRTRCSVGKGVICSSKPVGQDPPCCCQHGIIARKGEIGNDRRS